jgi:hypothetical protein
VFGKTISPGLRFLALSGRVTVIKKNMLYYCSDLNMKCLPPQAYVLNARSPAGGSILGGSRNFRRWGLIRGSRSLDFESYTWSTVPFSLSLLLVCSYPLPLWRSASKWAQKHRARWPWTEPFETISQNKSSLL